MDKFFETLDRATALMRKRNKIQIDRISERLAAESDGHSNRYGAAEHATDYRKAA